MTRPPGESLWYSYFSNCPLWSLLKLQNSTIQACQALLPSRSLEKSMTPVPFVCLADEVRERELGRAGPGKLNSSRMSFALLSVRFYTGYPVIWDVIQATYESEFEGMACHSIQYFLTPAPPSASCLFGYWVNRQVRTTK